MNFKGILYYVFLPFPENPPPTTQIWINPYIFFEPFPLCDVMVRIIPRMMDSAVKLFEKDVSSVFANKRVFKTIRGMYAYNFTYT